MTTRIVVVLGAQWCAKPVAKSKPLIGSQSAGESINNMFRQPSTDASGRPFDETIIEAVWSRAPISSDHPPMRVDAYGALIWREGYGNTGSKFGWQIGYKSPLTKGGKDELENLQPLQWENSRRNGLS
jgi:hypothetical protein